MIEVDVQSIALFFFFALLDEQRAMDATAKALQNCRDRLSKNPQLKMTVAVVQATHHTWEKSSERFSRGKHHFSSGAGWTLPTGVDMGPWKEFQKVSQEDEFLALIWSQILKFSDEDIAQGLAISIGTLRYRNGRALRRLGGLTHPVLTKNNVSLGIVRDE